MTDKLAIRTYASCAGITPEVVSALATVATAAVLHTVALSVILHNAQHTHTSELHRFIT